MPPLSYYQSVRTRQTACLQKKKKIRNIVTVAKLIVAAGFFGSAYQAVVSAEWQTITGILLTVVLFILLAVWDSRILRSLQEAETAINLCRAEENYLQGHPENFPTGEKFNDLSHPYAYDLDLFGNHSLFQHLNRTVTADGEKTLASWLLNPCPSAEEITGRQAAAGEIARRTEWWLDFRIRGEIHRTAEPSGTLLAWTRQPGLSVKKSVRICIIMLNILTLLSWSAYVADGLALRWPAVLTTVQILLSILYLGKINRLHNKTGNFVRAATRYFQLIRLLHGKDFHSPVMKKAEETFFGEGENALVAFKELKKKLAALDQRNNVLVAFFLNSLYMRDFHIAWEIEKWKKRYAPYMGKWMETLSRTDALVSMAVYRFNHPGFTCPEVSGPDLIKASDMGHPLLKNPVLNDFSIERLHELYIITGANMAGKSTFLRAVGINLVLALSGNVVCSKQLTTKPMHVFTSMRTTDNLAKGTSYFHAELIRLQQMQELATRSKTLFIILDEMLKGTNSQDKLNGSVLFLERVRQYPVSGLIATHDLALGDLASRYPDHFKNVCFEITHNGNDIQYDYKLKTGISRNMNASILLKKMGLI